MREHLYSQAAIFIVAGHESTAASIGYLTAFLSHYPLIADQVFNEIKSVLQDRDPTPEDVEKLTYTKAVLKETLRLFPPMRLTAREVMMDDVVDGYPVKKGDLIMIPIFAIQHSSQYWPNPEGFDPTRHLNPLNQDQRWMYLPFGMGEQNCIGSQFSTLETLLIIAMLIQRYQLELMPGSTMARQLAPIDLLNDEVKMYLRKR